MTNVEVRDKLQSILTDKFTVLDRVLFNLLPKGYKNREHVFSYDISEKLCLQFKVDISDVMADSNVVLFEDTLKLIGVSRDDIYDAAIANTENKLPARFDSLCDMLHIEELENLPMYVLSNDKQVFGAGAILYEGMYNKIFDIVGDFIIIPSSVHEVIILPEEFNSPFIAKMIREVNRTTVIDTEVLSDVPYRLTPAGDLIEI